MLEKVLAVSRQGLGVLPHQLLEVTPDHVDVLHSQRSREFRGRDQEGRPAGEPRVTLGEALGQFALGPAAVLATRLRHVPAQADAPIRSSRLFKDLDHPFDIEPLVPDIEVALFGQFPHHQAVLGHAGQNDLPGDFLAGSVLPGRNHRAGGHPFHVPLPGGGQRFVEIVQVEDQLAVGCRIAAEVRDVSIAAGLDPYSRGWRIGQVGGHDRGTTPVERERGGGHPSVADRQEILDPALALGEQDPERIPALGRFPLGMTLAGSLPAQFLSGEPG